LLRTIDFIGRIKPDRLLFLTAKHALNALRYKNLALAEVEPPIVVIAPDPSYVEGPYMSSLKFAGAADLIMHSEKLFGRSFADSDEVTAFMTRFSNPDELIASISDRSRLLFDTAWVSPLKDQIKKYIELFEVDGIEKEPVGKAIEVALLGRMMQANDAIFRASQLGGNPLIDAPTSWQYLLWKYEYDASRRQIPHGNMRDMLVTKVVSIEGSAKLGLLSGLPPEVLIDLRRSGAMADLQTLMRSGIHDVDVASASSLAEVGEVVVNNLSNAFAKHKKELEGLSSARRKFFGFDVGRWIAFGGISIGAASAGSPGLAVLAASLAMIGAPRIDELWRTWKEAQSQNEQLKRSPAGILFRHLKRG